MSYMQQKPKIQTKHHAFGQPYGWVLTIVCNAMVAKISWWKIHLDFFFQVSQRALTN